MNDLYLHQLETENKQLRIALHECRKALEEEITTKKKAIEYIKECTNSPDINERFISTGETRKLLKILGGTDENNNI